MGYTDKHIFDLITIVPYYAWNGWNSEFLEYFDKFGHWQAERHSLHVSCFFYFMKNAYVLETN
jgi:hypothetical protein